MKLRILLAATTAAFVSHSAGAFAETQIQWWHAMGGQLGETVNQIAADFNAAQDEVEEAEAEAASRPDPAAATRTQARGWPQG